LSSSERINANLAKELEQLRSENLKIVDVDPEKKALKKVDI
jgi:hypothetical protein